MQMLIFTIMIFISCLMGFMTSPLVVGVSQWSFYGLKKLNVWSFDHMIVQ